MFTKARCIACNEEKHLPNFSYHYETGDRRDICLSCKRQGKDRKSYREKGNGPRTVHEMCYATRSREVINNLRVRKEMDKVFT